MEAPLGPHSRPLTHRREPRKMTTFGFPSFSIFTRQNSVISWDIIKRFAADVSNVSSWLFFSFFKRARDTSMVQLPQYWIQLIILYYSETFIKALGDLTECRERERWEHKELCEVRLPIQQFNLKVVSSSESEAPTLLPWLQWQVNVPTGSDRGRFLLYLQWPVKLPTCSDRWRNLPAVTGEGTCLQWQVKFYLPAVTGEGTVMILTAASCLTGREGARTQRLQPTINVII